MSIPADDIAVPARVRELAGDARLEPVWQNMIGGLTFRATGADGLRFVKYAPVDDEVSMAGEAERLAWASAYTTVPRVLTQGRDAGNEWLVTEAVPGRSAVDPLWVAQPAEAVRAIGRGLRALHESLPTDECPFDWGVPARLDNAAARGIRPPDDLGDPPPVDLLVVCHGDACAPNTLIDDDGTWSAHVDLGALGLADRWADIAVAALSCDWNYGPGWQESLVEAYGLPIDRERMAYYQALWTAV